MTKQTADTASKDWLVRDLNAKSKPRTHDLRVTQMYKTGPQKIIKRFTFPPFEQIPVPMEAAMDLVGIDGFEVHTPEGKLVRPQQPAEGSAPITLKPGEVIAKLDELDMGALRTRARALPGGETFVTNRTKKEDLCSFILGGGDGPVHGDIFIPVGSDGEMDLELEDED